MTRALGVVIVAIPVAFGVIRAVVAGDFRYVWVALASTLGAELVWLIAKHRGSLLGRTFVVLVVSMALATAAGLLLGTRLALGLIVVAGGFAACTAAGYCVLVRSAKLETGPFSADTVGIRGKSRGPHSLE